MTVRAKTAGGNPVGTNGHARAPVAEAWATHAGALAAWFNKNAVNRRDAFGHYIAKEHRTDPDLTAFTDKAALTLAVLERHFRARSTGDLIGLHSTARDEPQGEGEIVACWSRFLVIDIDAHGDNDDREAMLAAADALVWRLKQLGFVALLVDSGGGFHIWVFFAAPAPTERVYAFGKWLVRDWKDVGLAEEPEVFPKQPAIGPDEFGNWIRIPGRHHTRDAYSRVRDRSKGAWLESTAAIKAILGAALNPADMIPAEAVEWARPKANPKPRPSVDPQSDAALADDALRHVTHMADDYGNWLRIGMALTPLGHEGLSLWDSWSSGSTKYQEGACERKWKSFRRSGTGSVTLGTLFHEAKRNGYAMPKGGAPWTGRVPGGTGSNGAAGDTQEPHGQDGGDDQEVIDRWPRVGRHAFHGAAGEFVRAVEPHTDADPVAILVQLLIALGNQFGRNPYYAVGGDRHYTNEFAALVGATAVGRKGSSWGVTRYAAAAVDEEWSTNRVTGGMVSGEGLIYNVRDAVYKTEDVKEKGRVVGQQRVLADGGVTDKRLLVVETEMGRVLKAMNRPSNTLSDVVRQAWDTGNLATLAKNNGDRATNAHISVIAHVTQADVQKHLLAEDSLNGFANRFLWIAVRRSKVLPDGGDLEGPDFQQEWEGIRAHLHEASVFARSCGRMRRDREATAVWHEVYEELSAGRPGILGAILSRAEAHVTRLACLYALLDTSSTVRAEHMTAALSLWEYAEASARYIFGARLGDTESETLLKAIKAAGVEGLTQTEISVKVFGGHKKAAQIASMLSELLTAGEIHLVPAQPGGEPVKGRKAKRWRAGRGEHGDE